MTMDLKGDADDPEADQRAPELRSSQACYCTRYINGQPCRQPVVYPTPHDCEQFLSNGIRGMRMTKPRPANDVRMALEPCAYKIGDKARKKLERLKQAQSGLNIKLSPVPLDVFKGLYNMLANLQPSDGGRHLTPLQQVAGRRGGNKQEH
eukprot:3237682-Pleurochrysis_carterae.AAC.1